LAQKPGRERFRKHGLFDVNGWRIESDP
jgi:hypothetical protein